MFIITAKLPRRGVALGTALSALCLCALLALFLTPPSISQASGSLSPNPKGRGTDAQRVAYLQEFGWEVNPEPLSVEELRIPEDFDEVYLDYLKLQEDQGFQLRKYAGKRVKRYTYEILNYPSGETGVLANLLLYRKTVVGGEVLSPELDGFLHGLEMPTE